MSVQWIEDLDELLGLLEGNENKVVIDFTAPSWCNPCRQFAPHYDKASELSDATFVAVDVDKAPWAMEEFGVRSVPTVVLYNGEATPTVLKERTVVKFLAEIS